MSAPARCRRVVAVRFSALGDVAMTVPVIYSVARKNPETEFYVATRPFFARLFINPPSNVRVIPFDVAKEYRGVKGIFRIARELGRLHPDCVADLHDVARSWTVTRLLGLRGAVTAGVDKERRSRHRAMAGGPEQTSYIDRYFSVFRKLGLDGERDFDSVFPVKPEPPCQVSHPAVGIAPFARYATKTYPPEQMKRTTRLLADRGIHVYLFGGRGHEAETLGGWEREGIVSVAGKFPIEEELSLMANLNLMVSMDSANQHLAALAGTKVLSVWGGTTPACGFLGYGQSKENVLCLGLPCQPCSTAGSEKCPRGDMECLAGLAPERIAEKVLSMI